MNPLNLNMVFKILLKSEGDWCGNKTLDESGPVMLEFIHNGKGRDYWR